VTPTRRERIKRRAETRQRFVARFSVSGREQWRVPGSQNSQNSVNRPACGIEKTDAQANVVRQPAPFAAFAAARHGRYKTRLRQRVARLQKKASSTMPANEP